MWCFSVRVGLYTEKDLSAEAGTAGTCSGSSGPVLSKELFPANSASYPGFFFKSLCILPSMYVSGAQTLACESDAAYQACVNSPLPA